MDWLLLEDVILYIGFTVFIVIFVSPIWLVWWEVLQGHFKIKPHQLSLRTTLVLLAVAPLLIGLAFTRGVDQMLAGVFIGLLVILGVAMAFFVLRIFLSPMVRTKQVSRRNCKDDVVVTLPSESESAEGDPAAKKPKDEKKWWARKSKGMRLGRYGIWH